MEKKRRKPEQRAEEVGGFGSFVAGLAAELASGRLTTAPEKPAPPTAQEDTASFERAMSKKRDLPLRSMPLPMPRTPPGWKKTGNPLYDLEKMYGQGALNDPRNRAIIRQHSKGKVDVKKLEGKWVIVAKQPIEQS